jgi:hypothetical protein
LAKVEEGRDNNKQAIEQFTEVKKEVLIEQLTEVNKEVLIQHLTQSIKCASTIDEFVKRIHRDLKREVVDQVYDGEVKLEKMKLDRIGEITQAYDSWVTYVEGLTSKKN